LPFREIEGKSLSPGFLSRKKRDSSFPSSFRLAESGETGFPSFSNIAESSAAAAHDPLEAAAVHPELRDGDAVPQKHGDGVREAFPEIRIGVDVPRRPGKAVGRQDFVEQQGHLIAQMASLAGHELVVGGENGSAEEHGGRIA